MPRPLILATNDDGVDSPALALLVKTLTELGEVRVCAPDREQSAVGHGVSLHRPLRIKSLREGWHSVDGTPADCVLLAVRGLLGKKPDLVVSGINYGANLGDDVTYSGTVAGAYEGMMHDVPSMAVSLVAVDARHVDTAAQVALRLGRHLLDKGLPNDTMLNVNVPDLPHSELQGIAVTRLGRTHYNDEIVKRTDPRGADYYWIGGDTPTQVPEAGTDCEAVDSGRVSVTPIRRDLTDLDALEALEKSGIAS